MRKGGGGFQSHNIFDVLEDTQNKKTRNNNESDDDSSDDEEQSYYCLEISGLPLFVEKTQFLPIASDFGTVTHIDCEKSGYVYVFYEQKHVATKTLMSIDGKRYQGKRMTVQFAPNKALPAVKKCYHCDKLGHFGIDCVEGALASMPEEIIALMCSFASLHQYNTTPMRVNKKWKRAIIMHTTYLEVHNKWSPLFDKFSNLNTLFVYNTTPNNLKCFPKLQTLVADIHVLNRLIDHEFPPSLKNIKADCVNYMVSALPQTWMQRPELAGLESLSFHEDIGGGLPFTFADVTHLTNLRRLDLLTRTSPKEHLSSLTRLEHLGCAAFDDLTPLDAKYLQRLTSFAALKYKDYNMTGLDVNGGSYTWLADLTQMKAITLRNIENNYNFKLWPNIQSLTIADVPHLPDTLDQLNVAQITELNLKIRSMGRFSKLSEFTNLVKLNIEAEAAANSIFLEIVKLKNLRHLEFKADNAFKAVDDDTIVGLADMPNLEHFSLTGSVNAIEALFLDEICELSTLTSITFQYGFENPRFLDIIRRFNKVKTITIWGSEGIHYHHAIILRHKLKGPEKITFNGGDIKDITECLCKECRERNLASSLDHLAIDPAPAVLAMEDHMLDVDEIRGGRSDEREKKLRKHDKTKMQRIEKQGNLSEKELRKKRNRRK